MRHFAIGAAAVCVVAASAAGAWWAFGASDDAAFAECGGSAVGADIGGPFELVSETGETVTDADVIDRPTLLYFGFTFCPDVCPLDAARMARATELLDARGVEVRPVFVSVDPKRDTPEVVRDFTDHLHPRMLGLTGSEAQVAAASRAYRTYYRAEETDDPYYLVDHSTFTYLVLPEHGFVEFFRRDATAEEMADAVACYVERA